MGKAVEDQGVAFGPGCQPSASAAGASSQSGIPNACRDAQRQAGIVRFRKLPVVIDAVRVNAADFNGHDWDGFPFDAAPSWLLEAIRTKAIKPDTPGCTDYAEWKIETREGAVWAGPDDWIVRGVHGEIYPCGGDIFEATYEPASGIEAATAGETEGLDERSEQSPVAESETPEVSRP